MTTTKENNPQGAPESPQPATIRSGLSRRLRTYLVTGIVVASPIAITIYLVWAVVSWVDGALTPLIPNHYNPNTYLPFSIPGLGLLIAVSGLIVLGATTANFFGRFLLASGESLVNRMPVVRSIYSTTKQVFETIASQNSSSFKEVVLVEYPRRGLWAIAFVTAETRGEVGESFDEPMASVFLPTTPNPTSGFLLFVPRKDLIALKMSVEDGIKNVISAGLVNPERGKLAENGGKVGRG